MTVPESEEFIRPARMRDRLALALLQTAINILDRHPVGLIVLACVLPVALMMMVSLIPSGVPKFEADCASRGGHAVTEPYWTCYDASGKPERPYR